ncbi:Rrf2 family transcriptional regulator [Candidatus Aerophobetes bacterium]|uniref:Rrf2 family transcriptional regulator n=1 Tax=Aerophobetes bacterium TaxID=2030807 RepID=A0A662D5R2_UNCAE|nr:MAG: Rrf2 family transcriptional regulator [Candidatus Aerophobetes bacterium]
MKLSTKGRYGTRAMVDLAFHYGQGPILLKDIAKRQQISEKYLEHIITSLKVAGLVKSIRGSHGGYILAKSPAQIKLSQVIKVLEGSIAPVECVDDPKVCSRAKLCVTRDIWKKIKRAIDEILESITLKDLVEREKKKEENKNVIYNILKRSMLI